MKKALLLVSLLMAGIAVEIEAAKFTVKFDASFINAVNGKEATYKFTPFITWGAKTQDWGLDILLTLNQDNKEGNHISKVIAPGKATHRVEKFVVKEEAALHKINNLNGGFIFGWGGFIGNCLETLKVEAETGPLAKQIAESTKSKKQCKDQIFVVKVENGKLKIDREKEATAGVLK